MGGYGRREQVGKDGREGVKEEGRGVGDREGVKEKKRGIGEGKD